MCGIVGYVGDRIAAPLVINSLGKLEYRGYDSAGIAMLEGDRINVVKAEGRISKLASMLQGVPTSATVAVGHTRWATHGRPSDENAHPHLDCNGQVAVVHNGIIENHSSLKKELLALGHTFRSQTDTEVVAHLIEQFFDGSLEAAVRNAVRRLKGSFAIAAISAKDPGKIVVARKDSPLVIGLGNGENMVASDVPAILEHTRNALILHDGDIACVTAGEVRVMNCDGRPLDRKVFRIEWDAVAAQKGGYPHFMLKEIHEQPEAIANTLRGRLGDSGVNLEELGVPAELLKAVERVHIVACGTAYHAGVVGKHLIEALARVPVEVDLASEFRYRDPILGKNQLAVVISQSGETADTIAALRESRKRGLPVLAVTNVMGSTVAREAGYTVYTWAGPEVAVASTKAYVTQLVVMCLLAMAFAQVRGINLGLVEQLAQELRALPGLAKRVLENEAAIAQLAKTISPWDDVFFIGRGLDYAVAMEGQLKLKEISYIHAEAYAAGELKHGTLALVTKDVPVIALVTQPHVRDKTLSNMQEVRAREGKIYAFCREGDEETPQHCDWWMALPGAYWLLMPVLSVIPLQLLAYYAAVARGCDVDKPRNLAKSVTVE
ncbi:MAG: glutamine--fructose-6-phosphate transaminase (isomerizing) [Bacillota bacterium]